jgi:hypothetical protein
MHYAHVSKARHRHTLWLLSLLLRMRAGLDELRVLHIEPPSGVSLSPSGPVLQEQQLAALQQQLPSLNMLPPQQQQQQQHQQGQLGGGTNSSSSTSGSNASSMAHAVEATSDTSMVCNTDNFAGLHTTAGQLQPANALGPAAAAAGPAACPGIVVVFLSNTMGSTSYGVAQDASVHIIRGEHRTVQCSRLHTTAVPAAACTLESLKCKPHLSWTATTACIRRRVHSS